MQRPLLMLALLWLSLSLAGCTNDGGAASRDDQAPQRIVVLAPAAAEMLEALGLLDRVVGIGQFGPWPGAISGLPAVGGYDSPNIERLLELRCDLLLTTSSEAGSGAEQQLRTIGVEVLALETATFDGVFDSLTRVGRLFGKEAEANGIASDLSLRLQALANRAEGLQERRVLFVVGRDPLYVAGPGSHIDEMIRMVGGVNVAGDAHSPYQQLSMEAALERVPDIIIDASDNRPAALRGRETGIWGRWDFLPAVREGRVYHIDPGKMVIPGLRLTEMTELMGQLIHPEVFGEQDAAQP
jgi:iron complex transport system substrate-binding protein